MNNVKLIFNISFVCLISLLYFSCKTINKDQGAMDNDEKEFSYLVKQSNAAHPVDANWDKEIWNNTQSISLDNFMGDKPAHFPETKAKVRYDKDNIYVIFSVQDQYIRAVANETNGKVWEDSCVEFFFSPGPDTERGYFNLEANCKGVFLLQYHLNNGETNEFVKLSDCEKINISHSLTKDVEQELTEPENWTLEYRIPISILSNYMEVVQPEPGVSWRANFYKCADKTSHPHWLTWAPVDYPNPKFHLPEFFGRLDFD